MMANDVDPKTLTRAEIQRAVIVHCNRMGSFDYYIGEEMEWYDRDPEGIRVWRDHDGALRAYHTRGRKS